MSSPAEFPAIPLWIGLLYHVSVRAIITTDVHFHRKGNSSAIGEAAYWVVKWVAAGLGIGGLIGVYIGGAS